MSVALELAARTTDCPRLIGEHGEDCDCKGTGQVPLLEGVRDECQQVHSIIHTGGHSSTMHNAPCSDVGCLGYTVTQDLERWLEAGADNLKVIVMVRNDGPGWRCDLYKNTIHGECLVTGWSDGGFHLEGPSDYRPTPIEAVLRAYEKLLALKEALYALRSSLP
jgi:hypothetical protein